jgi:hypothetical protein
LQLDWRNYMLPVDAKLTKASDVPEQSIDVAQVIDAFKTAGNRMNIVVLDACRDNPFASTASGKGLAQLDAPPGTFLAYATAPGNVAEDGTGQNGLYTSFLLQELKKPQAKIEDVFKRVRLQVRQKSEGRQIPWESTSLEDDFFFNSGVKSAARQSDSDREKAFSEEKTAWDKIKDSRNVDDFYAFLQRYPTGHINAAAQAKLEELQRARTVAVADKDGLIIPSVVDMNRAGDRYVFRYVDGLTKNETGRAQVDIKIRADGVFEGSSDNTQLQGASLLTPGGLLIQDRIGVYDPPFQLFPNGELKIGSKANSRTIVTHTNGFKQWMDVESRVVGREKIDTALGPMMTIRVESTRLFQNGNRAVVKLWYDPQWSYSMRMQNEVRYARGGAPEITMREIVSRSRTPG